MTFDEMAQLMTVECSGDARQLPVQSILKNLRLKKCMTDNEVPNQSGSLSKLVEVVEGLKLQCHSQFRSDATKINFLRKATIGFKRTMIPLGNIITAKYTFRGLFTALREQLRLDNELSSTSLVRSFKQSPHESKFFQRY